LPYGAPFTLKQCAKLIFNCNELPKEVEQTNAYFRRFLIIPFDITIPSEKQIDNWNAQLEELDSFFKNIKLPKKEIKLNQCATILNVNKFITSHLATVKANNGNLIYLPYLERLQKLKVILKQ
jgi:hypothetical protein